MLVEASTPFEGSARSSIALGAPCSSTSLAHQAQRAERLGFNALHLEADQSIPYAALAMATDATTSLRFVTTRAVLAESPATTARSAWKAQARSGGRFELGLQSMTSSLTTCNRQQAWTPRAPQMRDYILAIQATWRAWQQRRPVRFTSDHYSIDLDIPRLGLDPIDNPNIPLQISGAGPPLYEVAGELASGIRLPPPCTPLYINQVVRPALNIGASKAARGTDEIEVCVQPLVGLAPDAASLDRTTQHTRARVAFYLSVAAYRRVFELHGWGSDARRARQLAANNQWRELPALVTDDLLHTFATIGTYADIADKLLNRFETCADRILLQTSTLKREELDGLSPAVRRLADIAAAATTSPILR